MMRAVDVQVRRDSAATHHHLASLPHLSRIYLYLCLGLTILNHTTSVSTSCCDAATLRLSDSISRGKLHAICALLFQRSSLYVSQRFILRRFTD